MAWDDLKSEPKCESNFDTIDDRVLNFNHFEEGELRSFVEPGAGQDETEDILTVEYTVGSVIELLVNKYIPVTVKDSERVRQEEVISIDDSDEVTEAAGENKDIGNVDNKVQYELCNEAANTPDLKIDIEECNINSLEIPTVKADEQEEVAVSNSTDWEYLLDMAKLVDKSKNDDDVICTGIVQSTEATNRWQCDVCGMKFNREMNYRGHRLLQHESVLEVFECDICRSTFTNKTGLRKHITRHFYKLNFECDVCKKLFQYKGNLRKHRLSHEVFKCDFCNRRFAKARELRSHKLAHQWDKRYHCTKCRRHFSDANGLKCHMSTHKSDEDDSFQLHTDGCICCV